MNKNIDLCKLLKGHEGETFYSPMYGKVILFQITDDSKYPICVIAGHSKFTFSKSGKYNPNYTDSECMLFPSKDQRDWEKWVGEHKFKVPKTWSELISNKSTCSLVSVFEGNNFFHPTPIEKAALALLKIHQLIEVGYGGNITKEEWVLSSMIKWTIKVSWNSNITVGTTTCFNTPIVFNTKEQAEEFLSYPENVQLVKNFYMI